jgi:hypothetical protein
VPEAVQGPCRAMRWSCRFPMVTLTASWPPRSLSTSPMTSWRWPSSRASCGPAAVPRYLPERICWALSDAYHEVEGGHVRIYTGHELVAKLEKAGLVAVGTDHAHGLHSPYWWLKCAVGVDRADHPLPKLYHRMLVWDIMSRPWLTRTADRLLNPLIGKSLVVYLRKPEIARAVV